MLVTNDAVSSVLGAALDGLAFRQRVTADNIANVDTPGFRATSVDFESALRDAISDPEDALDDGLGVVSTTTQTPVGANGNGVDLRKEALAAIQSQFQYQLLSRAVSERADLVRTSAGAA
ncbi:MAG TPA: flagellar basal body rod protein FlgB [Nocardioides sp.]|nr:flagellar basal body rod protein FlgB [Nocardioides sp.]